MKLKIKSYSSPWSIKDHQSNYNLVNLSLKEIKDTISSIDKYYKTTLVSTPLESKLESKIRWYYTTRVVSINSSDNRFYESPYWKFNGNEIIVQKDFQTTFNQNDVQKEIKYCLLQLRGLGNNSNYYTELIRRINELRSIILQQYSKIYKYSAQLKAILNKFSCNSTAKKVSIIGKRLSRIIPSSGKDEVNFSGLFQFKEFKNPLNLIMSKHEKSRQRIY